MKKPFRDLNKQEKWEQGMIEEIFATVCKMPVLELHRTAGELLAEMQPALADVCRYIYRRDGVMGAPFEEVMRLMIVVWSYYIVKMPDDERKIDVTLYTRMMHNHAVWEDSLKGRGADGIISCLVQSVEHYPSRVLYGFLMDKLIAKPGKDLKAVPAATRFILVRHFKTVLDCYEDLVRTSPVQG